MRPTACTRRAFPAQDETLHSGLVTHSASMKTRLGLAVNVAVADTELPANTLASSNGLTIEKQ